MFEFLKNRGSVRSYSAKKIDTVLLTEILEAAAQSSNTGNMQTYSVIVTTDNELKNKLAPTHFNQAMVTAAPVVLTFCADFNRFTKWCELRNANPGYANFQSFISAAVDAIIFAQTVAIAAERAGLGICYLGTTTYNAPEIIDILNLPKLVMPITTLTLGYPESTYQISDRLPLRSVVHAEKYVDFDSEQINEIYSAKENNEFYKKFVSENSKETLAQVFTDIRYTRKNNEFFSDKYIEALKMQDFL